MTEVERVEIINRVKAMSEDEVNLVVRVLPVSAMIEAFKERYEAIEHKQDLINQIVAKGKYE